MFVAVYLIKSDAPREIGVCTSVHASRILFDCYFKKCIYIYRALYKRKRPGEDQNGAALRASDLFFK